MTISDVPIGGAAWMIETLGALVEIERRGGAVDRHRIDAQLDGVQHDPGRWARERSTSICAVPANVAAGKIGLEHQRVTVGDDRCAAVGRDGRVTPAAYLRGRRVTARRAVALLHVADRMNRDVAPRYDVVGVGNALVDVIAHADDHFIDQHELVKGSMTLVDTDRALHIYRALGGAVEMSGGSAANTMCGIASFGGRAAYIGKVSDDDLGQVFGHDLRAVGVQFRPGRPDPETPTGRCIIVVTPDAERTMNTYLGVSSLLHTADIDDVTVAAGAVLYMEGYLFDRDEAKAAFRHAAGVAHAHDRLVSLTLSDSFCVDRHRVDFRSLVTDEVDVLFGNEHELVSLYEVDRLDRAIAAVQRDCSLAVITTGAEGCLVVTPDGVHARACRTGRAGARHHRGRRPVRSWLPVRLHASHVAGRLCPARLDRRGRGHLARRPAPAGGAQVPHPLISDPHVTETTMTALSGRPADHRPALAAAPSPTTTCATS